MLQLKEKVALALNNYLQADQIRLADAGGISGVVVSQRFSGVDSLDRQRIIRTALGGESAKLSSAERRRILAIAALTPAEYDSLGRM